MVRLRMVRCDQPPGFVGVVCGAGGGEVGGVDRVVVGVGVGAVVAALRGPAGVSDHDVWDW